MKVLSVNSSIYVVNLAYRTYMVLICISTFLQDNLNYFIIFANLSYLFTSADLLFNRV